MFIIYSKENCPNCEKAKMVLYMKGKDFEVKKLDVDFTVQEFMEKFNSRSFPVVIDTDTNSVYKTIEQLQEGLI